MHNEKHTTPIHGIHSPHKGHKGHKGFISQKGVECVLPMPQTSKDSGGYPFVIDIEKATKMNKTFRTALWTGEYLQLTVMSLLPGEDIGLEVHPNTDQFVRVEEGEGLLLMGDYEDQLTFKQMIFEDEAFIIPAGKWHNFINMGDKALKLYSLYGPPEHPFGTVHQTKADDK